MVVRTQSMDEEGKKAGASAPRQPNAASAPVPLDPAPRGNATAAAINPAEQRRLEAQRRQQLAEQLKPFKQRRDTLDRQLAQLQAEQTALHAQLQGNLSPAQLAEAGKRLKQVDDGIAEAEEAWLEVASEIEAIEQAQATAS